MARSRKSKFPTLTAQADPKAPLDPAHFLSVAQGVLDLLTKDLLARADESPGVTAALKARHAHEKKAKRTADGYAVWRRRRVVQIAAAWVLSCVFVRTLEDRGLLGRNRLAGPGALDAQRAFFGLAPNLGLREYLLAIFAELDHFPAAAGLFDREHNLCWRLGPSPEGAKALVGLFRGGDAEAPYFRFGQRSTRFLGDLYQDLSEDVRKRYALLQTPDFVEGFILDRTLEPAIGEFGLGEVRVIDPTCGSGHFLLGAFERLYDHWSEREPGGSDAAHVEKALAGVYGADLNPYAVSIARFRLTLAAVERLGVEKLRDAPELRLNVVVADSLIYGRGKGQRGFADLLGQETAVWEGEAFAVEDEGEARRVLGGEFAAVVGNPPYITVKDKVLRDRYREMYASAYRSYSLAVPFMERFFGLAREGGFVGQITANSFMKREFGKKLIEDFLPTVDLTSIVNTSGAYIPGHGTPTVILFGRNREPVGEKVHAVLARRGEPSTPEDPAQGKVWSAIREHGQEVGYEDEYVTVASLERESLANHPWSLEGGGAAELKELIESRSQQTLDELVTAIGRSTHTGEDSFFFMPAHAVRTLGLGESMAVALVKGEQVRDWSITEDEMSLFPYDMKTGDSRALVDGREFQLYWTYRALLRTRMDFGQIITDRGLKWYEHSMFFPARYRQPLSIAFAFVATHNHFVLDRGGKVFKQSAPIIKLPEDATEDDHLALLAYLNSSTACFWMKQVFQPKGATAENRNHPDPVRFAREFAGTAMKQLPLPPSYSEGNGKLSKLGRLASTAASERNTVLSPNFWTEYVDSASSLKARLHERWKIADKLKRSALWAQEEIDWEVYRMFGLSAGDLTSKNLEKGSLSRGDRAFEREFGQRSFVRKAGKLLDPREAEEDEDPPSLSKSTATMLEQRREAIRNTPHLQVVENYEFKRLWRDTEANMTERAFRAEWDREQLHTWLLDRLEDCVVKAGKIVTKSWIVQKVGEIPGVTAVKALLDEMTGSGSDELSGQMLADNAVPGLAALTYTSTGLEKLRAWQEVWRLQRREDAGETVDIPIPPSYSFGSRGKSKDFRSSTYWRLRGKLDVPKERFISYPHLESDNSPHPLYGHAGWNHAQRAEALFHLYHDRRDNEGWDAPRLTPILAGILELLPWIEQWHDEPDEDGERLAEAYEVFLDEELRTLGLTRTQLRDWRPPKKSKGRRKKKTKTKTTS